MDKVEIIKTAEELSLVELGDDWADTKVRYRLFANEKTTSDKILSPHKERTQERMGRYERSVCEPEVGLLWSMLEKQPISRCLFWLTVLARTDPDAAASSIQRYF